MTSAAATWTGISVQSCPPSLIHSISRRHHARLMKAQEVTRQLSCEGTSTALAILHDGKGVAGLTGNGKFSLSAHRHGTDPSRSAIFIPLQSSHSHCSYERFKSDSLSIQRLSLTLVTGQAHGQQRREYDMRRVSRTRRESLQPVSQSTSLPRLGPNSHPSRLLHLLTCAYHSRIPPHSHSHIILYTSA